MRKPVLLVAGVLALAMPAAAEAAIDTYYDRSTWLTDIGGTPDLEEDFSGFAADTDFRPEPTTVTVAMGTIGQIGTDEAFRNLVEVPPFLFTDNNGTNHASCFTNSPEGANPGTMVEIVFDSPVSAWGADFYGTIGGELLSIDIIEDGSGSVLGTIAPPGVQDSFMGFIADAGEQIGSVILRSTNTDPGGLGEGFGMDDLATAALGGPGVPVQEIPTLAPVGLAALVLALLAAAFLALRRRSTQVG